MPRVVDRSPSEQGSAADRRRRRRRKESTRLGSHLRVERAGDDVVVVSVGGLVDRLTMDMGDIEGRLPAAVEADDALVLDLCPATLLDEGAAWRLVTCAEEAASDLCLVCDRMPARLLLRRWGISSRTATFASLGDALQARVHDQHGYGSGWTP